MPDYFEIKAVEGTGIEDNVLYYGEIGKIELDLYPKNKTFTYSKVNWLLLDGSSETVRISNHFNYAGVFPGKAGYVEIIAEINGMYSLSYFPVTVKRPNVKLNSLPYNNILCVGKNQTVTFYSTKETEHRFEDSSDWGFSIGKYSTSIKCTVEKMSDNYYSATIYYYLYDLYDWEKEVVDMGKNFPVSPREMWELHHGGCAKVYTVEGVNRLSVKWKTGEKLGNGASVYIIS